VQNSNRSEIKYRKEMKRKSRYRQWQRGIEESARSLAVIASLYRDAHALASLFFRYFSVF
jgi:hypothetical protein